MIRLGVHGSAVSAWVSKLTTSPVTTTTGSTLVAWFAGSSAFGTGTIVDSKGNTWTNVIGDLAFHGTYHHISVWTCENATGGASHTVSFTPQGGQSCIGELIEIAGAASPSLDQVSAATDTAATTTTTAPINDLNANDLVLAIMASNGSSVCAGVQSPFTFIDALNDGGNNVGGGSAYLVVGSTGTYQAVFNNGGSPDVAGVTISFKQAGSSGTTVTGNIATSQTESTSASGAAGIAVTWDSSVITWDSAQMHWSDSVPISAAVISAVVSSGQAESSTLTGSQVLTPITGTISTSESEGVRVSVGIGVTGLPVGSYDVTGGMPDAQDAAGLTIRATYLGATLDRTLWLTKAKVGTPGAPGNPGTSGAPALNFNLSEPAILVFCYAEGTPTDPTFATANGVLQVMLGTTDVTSSCTLSATGIGCTGTVNTATNTPLTGHPIGWYQITGFTSNQAQFIITIVYSGFTYQAVVSLAKAKGGYEIVSSLPVANLFEGRVVMLTTDGKLYRYHSGAWTAAVPTLDLTGQIQAAQVAGLDAAMLGGQITSTQIADGSISTPKLAAGSVTAAAIAAGSISASKLVAGTITSNEIAANTITGGDIAANTITGNKLAAASIITATAQINDGVILSAKIGNLQVQSANIADLTVGTLKITANAVSSQGSAQAGYIPNLIMGTTSTPYWNNICTASLIHDGVSNIALTGSAQVSNQTTAYFFNMQVVYKNGATVIGTTQWNNMWAMGGYGWFSGRANISYPIMDVFSYGAAATITATLQIWTANSSTNVEAAGILLLENKK